MSISGLSFWFWRFFQIVTLIPIVGMLAYFVHLFTSQNILTPDYILVLFITSVLAAAWAISTIILYAKARHSAFLVAIVDLAFVGCFIAGVYLLRFITGADCTQWRGQGTLLQIGSLSIGAPNELETDKTCAMLKASFALGVMNTIFFFFTFFFALLVRRNHKPKETVVVRRHSSRHSHRGSRDYDRGHRSHRSSSRRYYV